MKNIVLIFSIFLLSILLVSTSYIFQDTEYFCRYELGRKLIRQCKEETSPSMGTKYYTQKGEILYLENIKDGDTVEVGTVLTGSISGPWYFEGVFPVRIFNEYGEILNTVVAQTNEEWMTEDLVNFSFTVTAPINEEMPVLLRIEKSNPTGNSENDDYFDINITLRPEQMESIKVFYPNSKLDTEMMDCSLVFPVTRSIPKTEVIAQAAIDELLRGVTEKEQEEGYYTSINTGVEVLSLIIEQGVAKIDFNSKLEEGIGGSCKIASIVAQITETLKQFSTIDSVTISIDGKLEDILQP
ncbi:GerMN domain-containing protein [Candidatus Dojkabacteria bacterium]|uniref:GerMN domain-containing protein n=1 Tax=Candidatus Dojkabacteria bacterium TaxID=2099670 RepID=A0A847VCX2_9BACT|nr:GerMN domain-containing protein [Candidatus Dojkabacteria bacterium]